MNLSGKQDDSAERSKKQDYKSKRTSLIYKSIVGPSSEAEVRNNYNYSKRRIIGERADLTVFALDHIKVRVLRLEH